MTKPRGQGKPFPKGQSGNPGGRPALPLDIVELCRTSTLEDVKKLQRIAAMDAKEDPALLGVQVRAIDSLLNRGWGTAPQTVTFRPGETTIRIITPLTRDKATAKA